jgi:hypothetical protein
MPVPRGVYADINNVNRGCLWRSNLRSISALVMAAIIHRVRSHTLRQRGGSDAAVVPLHALLAWYGRHRGDG